MDMMDDVTVNPLVHTNDFELLDFIDEANFDQFIDLIRGENEDQVCGFDYDLINGLLAGNQFGPTPGDMFDFNPTYTSAMGPVQNYGPNITLPSFDGDIKGWEEYNDGEDSSGTATTTTTTKKTKTDRSTTLFSERRRRGRMKEKLYTLRSLVPNITKMDKASIIGDAVLYVQELQMQAKNLKAEIADLEASLAGSNKNPTKLQVASNNHSICKNIMQMDVFQVEEREFYVRLVCNNGHGVAVSLYRTLQSLTSFNVQISNLATAYDQRFVFTFSLNVKENGKTTNLPNLKLWLTGALLNQGFEFSTSA